MKRERAAFDSWTVAHGAVGVAYGAVGLSFAQAAALSVAFEVVESRYVLESPGNVVVDILANLAGWEVGRRIVR
jgi:hypothetical protein